MAPKVKIEMMDDEEQQLVHTLPPLSELPIVAQPVDPQKALKSPEKGKEKKAPGETFPLRGPDTPLSQWMNAPLGVRQKLDSASQALRERGHHVLAHLTDLAGKVAPDSAADLANAALLGYGARGVMKGGVPEGTSAEEPTATPEAALGIETPTPPAAPKPVVPEPAPVTAGVSGSGPKPTATFAYDWPEAGGAQYHIEGGPHHGSTVSGAKLKSLGIEIPPPMGAQPTAEQSRLQARMREQYYANRNDPRDLRGRPGISPTQAPSPTAETKSPVRAALDDLKHSKGGVVAPADDTETPDDYPAKEAALMQAMAATGHPIVKVSGTRTAEQQAALFKKGRGDGGSIVTEKSGAPGDESRHQLGTASDFAFVGKDGKPDYDPKLPWATLGRMAKAHGFEWGGDWTSLKDLGHVQQPAQTASAAPATPPANGIKIEPMTPADHQTAPEKPLWRQALDPLMESAPFVAGATGGIVGGVAGAPSGPGAALLGAGGAYTGGVIGEGIRKLYRSATGQDLHEPATQTLDAMSASGRSQMYQEMLGLGLRSMLAARAAGKALGSAAATATSGRHGLKLSAADLSDSPLGRGLAQVMTYASASAKAATEAARRVGDSNAVKAVTEALNNLTAFHSNLDVGRDIQAGVRAGATGLKEGPIGQLYDATKKAGPDIDLRPHIQELLATFQREGTPASARRALLRLFPKPTNTLPAPVRWGATDPYMVTFEQAAKLRTRLGTQGRKALQAIGTDATSLATKLYGELSEGLTRAHPDFASASNLWRDARGSLGQRFVASVLKTSPDKIVKALGPTPSVETVDALRKTMLNLAQSAGPGTPEGVAGSQGFEALRRSWFDTHILRNAAGEADPVGMLARMRKANGAMAGFFGINSGDVHGQQLLDTATQIGQALQRRVPIRSPSPYTRGAELLGLLEVAAKAGASTAAKSLAGIELLPGFITWAMHRPEVAKAFVTGLTNSHTIQGAALLGRTLAGYFASGGPDQDPEPDPNDPENLPPYDPSTPSVAQAPHAPAVGVGSDSRTPPPRLRNRLTDPMAGAPINVHTFDPDAPPGGGPSVQTARATPAQPPAPAALQPKQTPSAWRKAERISAAPFDEFTAARREQEEWAQQPLGVVKAVGDKIRHWGEDVGAFSKGTEDWLLASLSGAFMGGTEGIANALEQNTTPEAIALSMVPLHEVDKLAELTRSLGRSAEGLPGTFSRLTRAVEAVPTNKLGMVKPKQILEAVKGVNPDESTWKGIVPFIREHIQANGEQAPISKQAVLDHLEKKKITLKAKTTGERSKPLQMGEPVPIPSPEEEAKEPIAARNANSLQSRGSVPHAATDITRVPVIDPDTGERIGLAHWYKMPQDESIHNVRPWRAEVPGRDVVAPGTPPHYLLPDDARIQYGANIADFTSEADAKAWVEARLAQGRYNPDFEPKWDNYAVPGPLGGNRQRYRETKITMPGGEGEGLNPDLDPDAFRADIHYADPNIVSTVRKQDYTLREGEAGIPEGAGEQKGILIDELQADVHEEAKRVYDKELARLRKAEVARQVRKGTMTEAQALREIPKRAFAKRHYEIHDQDGRSFGQRFLHEEDANRWLDAEKDNFPNAKVVPSKGLDPLHGYQQIKPSDPKVATLKAEAQAAKATEEQWSTEVDVAQANLETQKNLIRERLAKEKGYESWQQLNSLRWESYNDRNPQARQDVITLLSDLEADPTYQAAAEAQKEAAKKYQIARIRAREVEDTYNALGIKRGNFSLGGEHKVPDFPFKDPGDWSGLGLKHTLLEAAADPEVSFIGHVGGKEHADRYGLQNHFSKVRFDPEKESLVVYDMRGNELQSYDMGTSTPEVEDLSPYLGEEVAQRLKEKIDAYEPRPVEDPDGLPGTERERERADEEDYQQGHEREYEYQRGQHTVEPFERPELDDNGEPVLDEDGDPVTETKWRVFEDDLFDKDDPDTWNEFDTEREADRYLERRLDSIMDSYEHEYSDDRYDHLDAPESEEFDQEAHPVISGLDLTSGGEGMLSFYDEQTKRRMESLLRPFGGREMLKVTIPGQGSRTAYAWIAHLTPEMKEQILKAGFSLMGLALALRDTNAPQPVKDAVLRAAAMQTRREKAAHHHPPVPTNRKPVPQGVHP